ncbi:phosphoglycerate mutase-like protein [Exidia glandulosa HHB12029]|uniref:Phosphoglycerate mutase-like protein n=1 Tax=Exidia glandulosa HHB12029 TaxID=1314781 RepID=A0A165E7E3_EXIGL|nr:phosphoglycerate mutase-like protein [Exidia glandulosa HHB12029]
MLVSTLAILLVSVRAAFNPLEHSGPASPYFDAPEQFGIPADTPAGCTVDQAAYIVRHGSRYPEPGSFAGWQALFNKVQNATFSVQPGPLAFLPDWTPPVDDAPHEPLFLTSTGAREAFDLGVQLRKRYRFTPGGSNFTVWSAGQQRVVDTATYFLRGYLSQGNYLSAPTLNRGTAFVLPDSVNFTFADSLTPSTSCPNYPSGDTGAASANAFRSSFQANVAKRLNAAFLRGLTLNATDIGPMMDLCGFSDEIDGDDRFCDVFEPSEWLDYEYAHDLNYYYGSGPGNPFSNTVGFPWTKAVRDLFVVGPGKAPEGAAFIPPPLIMGFTHDNNIPPVVSALGIWNTSIIPGVYPLSHTKPNPLRNFRASYLVAFRGYVALERLTCSTVPTSARHHTAGQQGSTPIGRPLGTFVRVRINDAPVPIPGCTSGPGSTCSLNKFSAHVDAQGLRAGDFAQRCGVTQTNATSDVTFLTRQPDTARGESAVVLSVP